MPKSKIRGARHPFFDNAILLFGFVVLFWAIELLSRIPGAPEIEQWGVVPRRGDGLAGVFVAPLIHGDFSHLIGNTLPFLVLGGLVLLSGQRVFVVATFFGALIGGLGIWLFARENTVHIGASTLIFAYLGFLMLRAWFSRCWKAALVGLLACALYGGLVLTLLRHHHGVSWHGHAFGFLGGAAAAWLVSGDRGRAPRKAPIEL